MDSHEKSVIRVLYMHAWACIHYRNATTLMVLCKNHRKLENDHHIGELAEKLNFDDFEICSEHSL